ncbi:MAG TPA: response regulator [Candidatus Polarisedimenticolia bacterium]|nr:response regulator [Candidatus Polarisedimenticolia bacterium]
MMPAATTILHVEDDPNDTLLFQHACRKAGIIFDLQAVSDGDQAMAYLRGLNNFSDRNKYPLPKLILLDLKMPRVSGFDVLTWLQSQDGLKRVPVIVLTSSNHDADVKRAYDLGAKCYLVKPVGFEALVELVKTLPSFLAQI